MAEDAQIAAIHRDAIAIGGSCDARNVLATFDPHPCIAEAAQAMEYVAGKGTTMPNVTHQKGDNQMVTQAVPNAMDKVLAHFRSV